jgi:hypothetical protein
MNDCDSPIFLLAQARSGSTMLQRTLNSVPNVLISGEHLGALNGLATSYFDFMDTPGVDGYLRPPLSVAQLRDPNRFTAISNNYSIPYLQECYRNFIRGLANSYRHPGRWGFKEIRYGRCEDKVFEMLATLFPSAKFVFLIRNPVDQIVSKQSRGWWKEDSFQENLNQWATQVKYFKARASAHSEVCRLVRYEDISSKPSSTKELFQWLQLPFEQPQQDVIFSMPHVGRLPKKVPLSDEQDQLARQAGVDSGLYPCPELEN